MTQCIPCFRLHPVNGGSLKKKEEEGEEERLRESVHNSNGDRFCYICDLVSVPPDMARNLLP